MRPHLCPAGIQGTEKIGTHAKCSSICAVSEVGSNQTQDWAPYRTIRCFLHYFLRNFVSKCAVHIESARTENCRSTNVAGRTSTQSKIQNTLVLREFLRPMQSLASMVVIVVLFRQRSSNVAMMAGYSIYIPD